MVLTDEQWLPFAYAVLRRWEQETTPEYIQQQMDVMQQTAARKRVQIEQAKASIAAAEERVSKKAGRQHHGDTTDRKD